MVSDIADNLNYTRRMSSRWLALVVAVLGLTGCPKPSTTTEPAPVEVESEVSDDPVDAAALCSAGCEKLEACVPTLTSELDSDPADIVERLGQECDAACPSFEDQRSSLALRDCLDLDSCDAYWGCVGTPGVRPWLAAVAPVGDRSCANLCGQASACAIAQACELEPASGASGQSSSTGELDPRCAQDEDRRDELEEVCRLQCQAAAEDSRARTELIGCIDHASCGGLLGCLDTWADTDYGDERGPIPGVNPTCDAFCSRSIVCGAALEEVELEPEELAELKQRMTSTYIECTVQCSKDLETGGDATSEAFAQCTEVEDCEAFTACALEV